MIYVRFRGGPLSDKVIKMGASAFRGSYVYQANIVYHVDDLTLMPLMTPKVEITETLEDATYEFDWGQMGCVQDGVELDYYYVQ